MEKRTPLYNCHVALGGKMVPFAGYMLPIEFSGTIEEHMAVRRQAGLFDVSHMGQLMVTGPAALANLNRLLTNRLDELPAGKARYSLLCNPDGGIIDDLLVYCIAPERYLIVVNAANRSKDAEWMAANLEGAVTLEDLSDSIAQIALQGPASQRILEKLTNLDDIPQRYYTFYDQRMVSGISCLISRTGYTGEDGFEFYCSAGDAAALWDALLAAGMPEGLRPCGLGARDTLRLEAGMPLYGHEMNETVTPFETGLGFAVKLDKDFIGRGALERRGAPELARVGLKITGRGIARENSAVLKEGSTIGRVTSGTYLPFLGGPYAMALIDQSQSKIGELVEIDVRGRTVAAEMVSLPFYKRSKV